MSKVAEPETRYDPVRLEEQLFKQPVKWLVRNVELFAPLGTFVAKVIFDIQVPSKNRCISVLSSCLFVLWIVFVLHNNPYRIAVASEACFRLGLRRPFGRGLVGIP